MDKEPYRVQSLVKAMQVLNLFILAGSKLSLSQISTALGVHKSTAYRIAITLTEGGLLTWDNSSGTYSLGLKILELSNIVLESFELRTLTRPHLEHLLHETGETIHLAVLDHAEMVYIDKLEGNRGVRLFSQIGKRSPIHCTALGKALLIDKADRVVIKLLEKQGMKRYTSRTITSVHKFLEHLAVVRSKGYALDLEEHEPLVHCVAAPIYDHTCKVTAAISTTVVVKHFDEATFGAKISLIKETAAKISRDLGCVGVRERGTSVVYEVMQANPMLD